MSIYWCYCYYLHVMRFEYGHTVEHAYRYEKTPTDEHSSQWWWLSELVLYRHFHITITEKPAHNLKDAWKKCFNWLFIECSVHSSRIPRSLTCFPITRFSLCKIQFPVCSIVSGSNSGRKKTSRSLMHRAKAHDKKFYITGFCYFVVRLGSFFSCSALREVFQSEMMKRNERLVTVNTSYWTLCVLAYEYAKPHCI